MRRKRLIWLAAAALLIVSPSLAETVSFRFAHAIPSINDGDINTWTNSYNSLWEDWQSAIGGTLSGEFPALKYKANFEIEVRIPIVSILSLSLSAGRLQSSAEGTVSLNSEGDTQVETHFISNRVTATPIKIGLSLSIPITRFPLNVVISGGRHIVFVRYSSSENYDALFRAPEKDYSYWYKKSKTFNSEALGFYAGLALELDLIRHLAVVVEGEQVWSQVDGFKGPYSYEDYLDENSSGKASLYYYESDRWQMNQSYSVLEGHKERPEEGINNLRQGEINLSGIIFKIGLRLKF